jgi:hypothetical protein
MIHIPLRLREATAFVSAHHRHNMAPRGHLFSLGAIDDDGHDLIGVVVVGRPVNRIYDDGITGEVLRLCTYDLSPKNVPSFLYAKAWRVWQAMGGKRMITYTLKSESGISLRAAGWKIVGDLAARPGWDCESRSRAVLDTDGQAKFRWEPCNRP